MNKWRHFIRIPLYLLCGFYIPISYAESSSTVGKSLKQSEPYRVCRRVNILRDYSDDKIKIYP